MRDVGGVPLMQMQLITGSSVLVTHWAYMTPYNPAVFTPPSPTQYAIDTMPATASTDSHFRDELKTTPNPRRVVGLTNYAVATWEPEKLCNVYCATT